MFSSYNFCICKSYYWSGECTANRAWATTARHRRTNRTVFLSFFLSRTTAVVGEEDTFTDTKLESEIVQNGCPVFSFFRATAEASSWLFWISLLFAVVLACGLASVPRLRHVMGMLPFVCSYHSMWFLGRSLDMLLDVAALVSALVIAPTWTEYGTQVRIRSQKHYGDTVFQFGVNCLYQMDLMKNNITKQTIDKRADCSSPHFENKRRNVFLIWPTIYVTVKCVLIQINQSSSYRFYLDQQQDLHISLIIR